METDLVDVSLRGLLGAFAELRDSPVDTLVCRVDKHLRQLLLHTFETAGDRECSSAVALSARLEEMSPGVLTKYLRHPEVCQSLRRGDDIAALQSAFGSAALSCSSSAIRVAGVTLDEQLPLQLAHPQASLRQPMQPSVGERALASVAVEKAVTVLCANRPLLRSALFSLTRQWVFRCDAGQVARTWAASSPLAIGRIVMVNAHRPLVANQLGEILLHETIHNVFSCVDIVTPLVSKEAGRDADFRSPWTGRLLDANGFVHSVFVWGVLHQFWRSVANSQVAAQRAEHCLEGFRADAFNSLKRRLFQLVPEQTASAVELTQRMVRAS